MLQPLSTLDPISTILGWDGGILRAGPDLPAADWTPPGLATYSDGWAQGQVCVDDVYATGGYAGVFEATAQPGAIQVAWETVSGIDSAAFNLYRGGER